MMSKSWTPTAVASVLVDRGTWAEPYAQAATRRMLWQRLLDDTELGDDWSGFGVVVVEHAGDGALRVTAKWKVANHA